MLQLEGPRRLFSVQHIRRLVRRLLTFSPPAQFGKAAALPRRTSRWARLSASPRSKRLVRRGGSSARQGKPPDAPAAQKHPFAAAGTLALQWRVVASAVSCWGARR